MPSLILCSSRFKKVMFTCKTLLSDSSPVLTSTFSKMHFLAVALVYAAADSSNDSDTLFAETDNNTGRLNTFHSTTFSHCADLQT